MDLLLVIDLQNEFINEYTKASIKDISSLIDSNKYKNIVFTRFINDENNPTYKKLNYHGCMDEEKRHICINTCNSKIIDKSTYSAYNQELINYILANNIKNIYICGIDIECCVLITAMNLFENGYDVSILKDYVYCTHGEERKNNALEILKENIGESNLL